MSGCDTNLLTRDDLYKAKRQTQFIADVGTGGPTETVTNPDTGVTVPTLQKALADLGWTRTTPWGTNPLVTEALQVIPYNNQLFLPNTLPYQVDSTAHPDPNALVPSELRDVSNFLSEDKLQEYTDLTTDSTITIKSMDVALSSIVRTKHFSQTDDGGGASYIIESSGTNDGWSQIELDNGLFAKLLPDLEGVTSLQAGIIDDNSTDYTQRIESLHNYTRSRGLVTRYVKSPIGSGAVRCSVFKTFAQKIVGNESSPFKISLFYGGATPVLGQILTQSKVNGIEFNSEEEDLENQRVGFAGAQNVEMRWCNFIGFRHNDPQPNAWGAYLEDCTRVYLYDCGFDNNSQSDFAVVDNNQYCGFIRPRRIGSTLVGNIEPNGNEINNHIIIESADLTKMYVLTNTRTGNPNQNITIKDSYIDELVYDGGDVSFENTDIRLFNTQLETEVYTGYLDFTNGGFAFGPNLVTDSRFSVTSKTGSANWTVISSSVPDADLFEFSFSNMYRGLSLNPNNNSGLVAITNANKLIQVAEGKRYIFGVTGRAQTLTGGFYGNYSRVDWLDNADSLIRSIELRGFRSIDNADTGVRTEYAIITAPAGAAKARLLFRNGSSSTTSELTLMSVSFNEVQTGKSNFESVKNEHALFNGNVIVRNSGEYKADLTYRVKMLTGDEVYVGSERYICTDDTVFNGGHWVGAWSKYNTTSA